MADLTDRELLELAAKAAGYELAWPRHEAHLVVRNAGGSTVRITPWNPLTDDGDALRLAVKLDIDISWAHDGGGMNRACKAICVDAGGPWTPCVREDVTPDKASAMRRAIVRAAAAIAGQPAQGGGA